MACLSSKYSDLYFVAAIDELLYLAFFFLSQKNLCTSLVAVRNAGHSLVSYGCVFFSNSFLKLAFDDNPLICMSDINSMCTGCPRFYRYLK